MECPPATQNRDFYEESWDGIEWKGWFAVDIARIEK